MAFLIVTCDNSAVACSIGSLVYRVKLLAVTDTTWFGVGVYIFSQAEISAGIICSCMLNLAALFRKRTSLKFHLSSIFPSSWFRAFAARSLGRPLAMNKAFSADYLHRDRSTDQTSKHDIELANGAALAQPKDGIMVTRGVEIF